MIIAENLSKTYRCGEKRIAALDDVSFHISSGELVAISGSSGSGKTTLMSVLGVLQRPSSGRYFLSGVDVSSLGPTEAARLRLKTIGFVFQNFQLLPKLTALENTELPLIYLGFSPSRRREIALSALDRVGLADRSSHLPGQLSGGQMQRVALARAIAAEPRLILADEPTGNLDPETGLEILSLLIRLNRAGHTVVIITHDRNIAEKAPRRLVIEAGRLVKEP